MTAPTPLNYTRKYALDELVYSIRCCHCTSFVPHGF